jgi:hypothetical protein
VAEGQANAAPKDAAIAINARRVTRMIASKKQKPLRAAAQKRNFALILYKSPIPSTFMEGQGSTLRW